MIRYEFGFKNFVKYISLMGWVLACGQKSQQSDSSLNADAYYNSNNFIAKSFQAVCEEIRNSPSTVPPTYIRTLDVLFSKASEINPTFTTCAQVATAFQEKKLKLRRVGSFLELGLIVKLDKPVSVDLAFNDLTNEHLTELSTPSINGSPSNWEYSLKAVDLSYNKLTRVGDLLRVQNGVRLLNSIEDLNLEGNQIGSLEEPGVAANEYEYSKLRFLNLSKNPLKLPYIEGKVNMDSATIRLLSQNSLVSLNLGHTGIDSAVFLIPSAKRKLMLLNLDGLNFTDVLPWQDLNYNYRNLNFPALISASARGSKGLPADFFSHLAPDRSGTSAPGLSYLDLSGSDLINLQDMNQLPELDILQLGQSRLTDFASIPALAQTLDVLSIYKTGVTVAPDFQDLGLLDAQQTTLQPGGAYVTAVASCNNLTHCMVGPESDDRTTFITQYSLCPKDQRRPDGSCAVKVGVCEGTFTTRYDAYNRLSEACCLTSASLYVGSLTLTPLDGKICAKSLESFGIYK